MKKYLILCLAMLWSVLHAKNAETIIGSLPSSLQDTIHLQAHRAYRQLMAYIKAHKHDKKSVTSFTTRIRNVLRQLHATSFFMWYIEIKKNSVPASPELTQRMRAILRSMGVQNIAGYHLKIYEDADRNAAVFPFEPYTVYMSTGTLDTGSQDIIDFTLAHECSHILYETPFKVVPLIAIAYGALTYALHKIKQACSFSSKTSTTQIIVEESLKIIMVYLGFRKYLCYREKQADLNAVQALGSAYGGIVDLGATYLLYGDDGNDPWHPSLQERISYLYDWECKNCKQHAHK